MRMTITELAEHIDAASRGKFIWNTDYNDLKFTFSRLLEEAKKAAQNEYLNNREPGQTDYPGASGEMLRELYYFHPQINSFGKFDRLLRAAHDSLKGEQPEVIGAFWSVYDTFQPIATELNNLKQYIKKGRKPSDDPTKTPPRTIDHTGTCPVCGRNIKIEHGVMYAHGFVVQGYRSGNCFGVGYPPIEVSDRGAKAFLGSLKAQKVAVLKAIEVLKVAPSISRYRRDESLEVVKRGDAGFDRLQASEIGQHESVIRFLTSDIKTFEEVIRIWKPTPLPDGNKDHMKGGE